MGGRRIGACIWGRFHTGSGENDSLDSSLSAEKVSSARDGADIRAWPLFSLTFFFFGVLSLQWIKKVLELGKDKVMGFTGELVPLLLGFEASGPRGKAGPVKSQARHISLQLRGLIRSEGRDTAHATVDYSQVSMPITFLMSVSKRSQGLHIFCICFFI